MWQAGFPREVRLRSLSSTAPVNLTATIGQLETNVDLADAAFDVVVPPGAAPITLTNLRENGPLGEK
jgi:outer membrane lipoprotein-sorting protein